MKRFAAIFILLFAAVSVSAQTDSSGFFVQSFKKLDWDLDARSNHPMLDQNNRRAALIKVVIPEAGFDFDVGVMGVVGVKQEVGEVWVYVPEGVRKITIRHQTHGIIRDYEFGCPIESATVYEMKLHVPLRPKVTVIVKDSIIVRDSIVYVPTPVYTRAPWEDIREWFDVKKQTRWGVLAVSNVPDPSFGLMATWHARKVGAYIKAEGKLKRSGVDYNVFESGDTSISTGPDGITDNSVIWNGHFTRLAITAGGIFRCTDWLGICCGAGYIQYIYRNGGVRNGNISKDYYALYKGLSLDFVGVLVRLGHLTTYISGNYSLIYDNHSFHFGGRAGLEFGIGYSF